jgi:hypothetical protein
MISRLRSCDGRIRSLTETGHTIPINSAPACNEVNGHKEEQQTESGCVKSATLLGHPIESYRAEHKYQHASYGGKDQKS